MSKKKDAKKEGKPQLSQTQNVNLATVVYLQSPGLDQNFINQQLILAYLKDLSIGSIVKVGQMLSYTLCGKRNYIKIYSVLPNEFDEWVVDQKTIFEATKESEILQQQPQNKRPQKIYGFQSQIRSIQTIIEKSLGHKRSILIERGFNPIKGVLIVGSSGVGKSTLMKFISQLYKDQYQSIQVNLGKDGKVAKQIVQQALDQQPCLIILDDLNFQKNDEDGIKELFRLFEQIPGDAQVLVLGSTLSLKSFYDNLRRSGRFEKEILLESPAQQDRVQILQEMIEDFKYPVQMTVDEIKEICFQMSGFSINDILSVLREGLDSELITKSTLQSVLKQINPSGLKDLLMDIPQVQWSDIGGYEDVKQEIRKVIEWPLKHPEAFMKLGVQPSKGILLYGPPGCCKTLLARAICTQCNLAFMAVKGPELFSKYVGDSEKAVRDIFRKARMCAPSVIFFDEIDAIAPQRQNSTDVADRVLIQLLTEMDGFDSLKNVIIVGATNRPASIDKALLRPGRFDHLIFVDIPDKQNREEIFKVNFTKMKIDQEVYDQMETLIEITQGYTGAEITQVCKEAGLNALSRDIESESIKYIDFQHSIQKVKPRVSMLTVQYFKSFQDNQKS